MSDPLSVAGTAVGITSLGIQVCQSLVKYLRAVRGRKEDIAEGVREVDRVVSLLCSLNSLLPEVGSANRIVQLQDCLTNCHSKLKKLQTFLADLNGSQQSSRGIKRATKAMLSVTYPFQQEKLTALRQSLRSVLDDLNLVISVISLDSDITIQEGIETIKVQTSSQDNDISYLRSHVDSNSVKLQSLRCIVSDTLNDITEQLHKTQISIQDLDQNIDGKLTILQSTTRSIEANSHVTIARLEEMSQVLALHSAVMENMGIQMKSIGSLPNPSFMTTQPDTTHGSICRASYRQFTSARLRQGCHCASQLPKSTTSYKLWNMEFEFEEQEHHLPSCKLWGTRNGMKRTAKAKLPLKLAWLSARMAVACFEYASGTSKPGLSIRCRYIVQRKDSPFSDLLHSFSQGLETGGTIRKTIHQLERLERGILSLYSDKLASPLDIDEYGHSHAQSVFQLTDYYLSPGILLSDIVENDELAHTFISVIKTLLEASGSEMDDDYFALALAQNPESQPVFQSNDPNANYLCSFVLQECCLGMPSCIISHVAAIEPSESLKTIIQESLEVPPIAKAVLSRDLNDLCSCVLQSHRSLHDYTFGNEVLRLSIGWSDGLKYLLTTEGNAYIDIFSNEGDSSVKTFMSIAMQQCHAESLRLLLDAGCYLDTSSHIYWPEKYISDMMARVIVTHLCERRARLLETAQDRLGLFLGQTSVAFADAAAAKMCAMLDVVEVPLHPSLRVKPGYQSIYHEGLIPLDAFHIFWEGGFHHSKSHDRIGFTPIMTSQSRWRALMCSDTIEGMIDTMYWLIDKGFLQEKATDPLKLGLNVCATGYHYIGALLAQRAANWFYLPNLFDQRLRGLKNLLTRQDSEDDCRCWCTTEDHGCSPLKLFLITYIHGNPKFGPDLSYRQHIVLHHELFGNVSLTNTISPWLKKTLRLLTFEALEMTHTCCSFGMIDEYYPYALTQWDILDDGGIFCHDALGVSELRSSAEEQTKAALLEELMVEFTGELSQYPSSARAFEVFIFTYWRRRISQLYTPDPNVVKDILLHQTFQGLGVTHPVRTRVFPETLQRLLGDDFLLTDRLEPASLEECESEVNGYGGRYCLWCSWDDKLQSDKE